MRQSFTAVPSLARKWRACLDQVEDSDDYFKHLSVHVGAQKTEQWTRDEQRMQANRSANVEVMDEFDVREEKGDSPSYCVLILIPIHMNSAGESTNAATAC